MGWIIAITAIAYFIIGFIENTGSIEFFFDGDDLVC